MEIRWPQRTQPPATAALVIRWENKVISASQRRKVYSVTPKEDPVPRLTFYDHLVLFKKLLRALVASRLQKKRKKNTHKDELNGLPFAISVQRYGVNL